MTRWKTLNRSLGYPRHRLHSFLCAAADQLNSWYILLCPIMLVGLEPVIRLKVKDAYIPIKQSSAFDNLK
jgi:hypothetical protein